MTLAPLTAWLRPLAALTRKELTQLWRDRILLLFVLYAFTVDIYLAGSGVTLQVSHARTVLSDADHGPAARELAGRLVAPTFRLEPAPIPAKAARERLDRGEAMLAIDIPPRFSADLAAGRDTSLAVYADTSNSVQGFLAASYVNRVVSRLAIETGLARLGAGSGGSLPMVENRVRAWYNPNQDDAWFMSLSQLLNIITVFAILLPASAAVREKERGTVEQLLVSPLTAMQILLPKVLAMGGVILLATALSLALVLWPQFGVPCRGSLPLFFALTALYVAATSGLGLFIATVARNMAQVGMLTILVLAPMLFLSGAWTPPEAMPSWLVQLMAISPLHHFMDIAFGILLKGQDLVALARPVAALALIGSLLAALGLWRFRRQFG
ncbi:ABC transporter permease [Chitinimonas sp.]|uniref:ABC transporter permease n=1 Tax=Chitinimonas sp. TaxID=1934313 RepID=UPI0035AEAF28